MNIASGSALYYNATYTSSNSNFKIYYTTDKAQTTNWTTNNDVIKFANTLESVRSKELSYGFNPPCSGTMDVVIVDSGINAHGGYCYMDFDPYFLGRLESSRTLRPNEPYLVASHEFFHTIQFGYNVADNKVNLGGWVIEGQARSLQDKWISELDSELGYDFASYVGEVKGYLKYPDRTLTDLSYPAALFWTYVAERFGTIKTEPAAGLDVMKVFWEESVKLGYNYYPVKAFNNMLIKLGYPTQSFETVFKDFIVSLVAKDLTGIHVPTKYKYRDEAQNPGIYGPVTYNLEDTIDSYLKVIAGYEYLTRYTPKFYNIKSGIPGQPIHVKINQFTQNQIYYDLLVIKNNDIISEYKVTGVNFSKTITSECDRVVLVVGALGNGGVNPSKIQYFFSSGIGQDLEILYPTEGDWLSPGTLDAPQKFVAQVQVIGQNGSNDGLEKDDFFVRFNNYTGTILSCTYVLGTYFLEIQPPLGMTDDMPDLTIGVKGAWYTAVSDTVELALDFWGFGTDKIQNNIILIESTSESGYYGKLDAAKELAKLLIDSFPAGGRVGVVHYGQTVTTVCDPVPIDTYRQNAKNSVWGIQNNSGASAYLGKGLYQCLEEFKYHCTADSKDNVWIIGTAKDAGTYKVSNVTQMIYGNYTQVNLVLIGPDAQIGDIVNVVKNTNGKIMYAFDPGQPYLPPEFDFMEMLSSSAFSGINLAKNLQRSGFGKGNGTNYWQISKNFTVEDTKNARLTVTYNSTGSMANQIRLRFPNGTIIDPTAQDHNKSTSNWWLGHFIFEIPNPTNGNYSFFSDWREGHIYYNYEIAVEDPKQSGRMYIGNRLMVSSDQVPIRVNLNNGSGPLLGINVTAQISSGREAKIWNLTLFDDGEHDDGTADDGIYGNSFTRTKDPAPYLIKAKAIGGNPQNPDFYREWDDTIPIDIAPNADGDDLPDAWELKYGLDLNSFEGINGNDGDPDQDGLTNVEEFDYGTNPINADTDGGGENDGSEVHFGRDPCNYGDDAILIPLVDAVAGNANVTLSYFVSPETTEIQIYRSILNSDTGFVYLTSSQINQTYVDLAVTNNQTYWYKIRTIGANNLTSSWSPVVSATPKTDLEKPWGIISINNGATFTKSPNVQVSLNVAPDVVLMRISSTPKFENATWEIFQSEIPFILNLSNGIQYIYAQFQDSQGNIGAYDGNTDYTYAGIMVSLETAPDYKDYLILGLSIVGLVMIPGWAIKHKKIVPKK